MSNDLSKSAPPFAVAPGSKGIIATQSGAQDQNPANMLNRRRFLILTGLGGLAVGVSACGETNESGGQSDPPSDAPTIVPATPAVVATLNHYVQIAADGAITLFTPTPEIGQGIKTSLPMIVAEELDADWDQVSVKNADINPAVFGPQFAGGSASIRIRHPELRKLGAMARHMLLDAAAEKLGVPAAELTTDRSTVTHKASAQSLTYGELAESAAKQTPPTDEAITYKKPSEYKLRGSRITGVDNERLVRGEPLFGIDVTLPGMLYASFVKCRQLGGRPKNANLDDVKALPGIVDAFILEGTKDIPIYDASSDYVSSGVVIVGKTTWATFKARETLEVDWDLSTASTDNSDAIFAEAEAAAKSGRGPKFEEIGDVDAAFNAANNIVEGYYTCDFVSHAQLEPQNCVAHYKNDTIEVWAPSQTPTAAIIGLMKVLGFAPPDTDPQDLLKLAGQNNKVTIHQTRVGGGFGRRLENDYVREAALIAKRVNAPVKLQWTREDDMAFDYNRQPQFNYFRGSITDAGKLSAWELRHVSISPDGEKPSINAEPETNCIAKLSVPNYRVINPMISAKTPTGHVRAPGSNTYAFTEQSFVHELAVAAERDHVEFLIELFGERRWTGEQGFRDIDTGRAIEVVSQVAKNADWGRTMPARRALGLSFYFSHAGHVAEIADVSVDEEKYVTVHKVWVVADIGPIINLSGAEAQAQGSVIDALSTMAEQSLTIKDGAIQQTNFHEYPLLRIDRHPEIDVEFLKTDFAPTGIGEPALPPLAAAVCNAIYTATGDRIRTLPISKSGYWI